MKRLLLAAAALAVVASPVFAQQEVPSNGADAARTAKPVLVWNPSCNPGGSPPGGYVGVSYNGAVCGPSDGAQPSVPINISTATTTTLVAGSSGKTTLVTHWDVVAGGSGNFQLEYGTGGCASGLTALTGPYPLAAQAGLSSGNGSASVLTVPAGKDLCAVTSAAVQFSGTVTYKQN